MLKSIWSVALLVLGACTVIPAQAQDFLSDTGRMSVEYMRLKPNFGNNPAYSINRSFTEFDPGEESAVRFNLGFQLTEYLAIRGSWFQFDQSSSFSLTNSNPNRLVQSAQVLNTLQLNSPETYRFIPQLPTFTLFDTPPRRLPPFPFPNSLTLGFVPDSLRFTNSTRLSTGDMELVTDFDLGGLSWKLGMGFQFSEFTQNYRATRNNPGGTFLNLPIYDPIALLIPDGALTISTDTSTLDYISKFTGAGPKLSFQMSYPLLDWLELFGSLRGSVLFGNRNETGQYNVLQQVVFFETTVNFGVTIPLTGTQNSVVNQSAFTIIPVGEGELGLNIHFGGPDSKICPFLRVSALGQVWGNVGNATNANANLTLVGYSATLGVSF